MPMTKVNAGFGFAAGVTGVGVGSGVETGTGVDFRARRPDCGIAMSAHDNNSAAHKIAPKVVELAERLNMVSLAGESVRESF